MEMKKNSIGNSKLLVSEIGFGGASIGNLFQSCTDETAQEIITTSWDLGIRYFDTAPEYGHGLSERRLGDALRQYPRDQYIISTKVGDILYPRHDCLPPINKFIDKLPFHLRYDYSYDGIMRAFEDSLQRLGLHYIDILLVHDLDPVIHEKIFPEYFKTYIENGYKALDKLRNAGVIKAIGLGIKKWEVCAEAMKYGDYECFMLQGNYTLLEQSAFASFMELCLQKQASILLAGPYASGVLATGAVQGAYFNHGKADEKILSQVKQIEAICNSFNTPMQAVAIQFPLKHPAISSVVVGSAMPHYMRENVRYLNYTIPAGVWSALKSAGIIPYNSPV